MEKEINVPSFVNQNYEYARQERKIREIEERRNEKKRIRKFKIYKGLTLFLAGAATGFVLAKAPVKETVTAAFDYIVDLDNARFAEETERNKQYTEELTGRTLEEIAESGKQIH